MEQSSISGKIVLGVDGGGTKTVCVVLDLSGHKLGEGRTASSNPNSVGDATAQANVNQAIQAALQAANRSTAQVAAICLGMAGVDRGPERARVTSWIEGLLPGVPVTIDNDAMIALASATGGDLYGVVLISGTGMIVYGVDRQGQRRRAGGWGALLGDKGSGYALGIAALTAIANATDGLGPPTALQAAILQHLQLTKPQELVTWIYADISWARFAALAPLVVQCAEQGDVVANAIIDQAADDLAATVRAVVNGLHLTQTTFPLVLAGGNLQPGLLCDRLTPRLQQIAPAARITGPLVEPATGAALLALKQQNNNEFRKQRM
ncbi:MAG: BadF/BadG/BcrA/BcrD ATPase family protein [Caldilineaceae bacterium]